MLGDIMGANLLVSVDDNYNPDDFSFYVINGAWEGKFLSGVITVDNHDTISHGNKILTDNQNQLRGEYQDVFNNFHNVDYTAPINPQFTYPESWNDNIPY